MKKLHSTQEEKWQFTSFAELRGVSRRVADPREVILLLHGLGERGKRIYRKLLRSLPADALIIAPNGPFPIRRNKPERMDFGHSWYFYDKIEGTYFVNQDLAKYWLRDLMAIENPQKLPVTIIGFSQGGYLSAVAGREIAETKLVIGLGCEFRSSLIQESPPFPIVQLHGTEDYVVTIEAALKEKAKLSLAGIEIDFYKIENTGHEITGAMSAQVKAILEAHAKRSL